MAELADPGADVVTDVSMARQWLMHRGRVEDPSRFYYLLRYDVAHELDALLHDEVGQRDAVLGALEKNFFGRPVPGDRLVPEAWESGTIVIFSGDPRLAETVDLDAWRRNIDILHDEPSLLVGRVTR